MQPHGGFLIAKDRAPQPIEPLRSQWRPFWRHRLLLALIPIIAGLGCSHATAPARHIASQHSAGNTVATKALGVRATLPSQWQTVDYSSVAAGTRLIVSTRDPADQPVALRAGGDLIRAGTASTVLSLGRPQRSSSAAGRADLLGVLSAEVAALAATPPTPGATVTVVQPVRSLTVAGHPAASVILDVGRGGAHYLVQRTLVYAPEVGGLQPILQVDGGARPADWKGEDRSRLQAVLSSLSFR